MKNRNSVPCCKVCNYAKSDMNLKEFQEWAVRIGKQAMAEQWTRKSERRGGYYYGMISTNLQV